MQENKQEYIERITNLLTETDDISLLDLVYKIMLKSVQMEKGKAWVIKIKVSYTDEQELMALEKMLKSSIVKVRKQPEKGQFKRAYIDLKSAVLYNVLVTEKSEFSH